MRKLWSNKCRSIQLSPFVIPAPGMSQLADTLRYRTIILDTSGSRTTRHVPNKTEVTRIMGMQLHTTGYQQNFTTKVSTLGSQGVIPDLYLINFKK